MGNLFTPKDKFVKWEQTRAKGAWRFVIFSGLYFALSFFIIFSAAQFIVPMVTPTLESKHFFEPYFLIKFLIICLGAGFFWSITIWFLTEAQYRKYLTEKKSSEFSDN